MPPCLNPPENSSSPFYVLPLSPSTASQTANLYDTVRSLARGPSFLFPPATRHHHPISISVQWTPPHLDWADMLGSEQQTSCCKSGQPGGGALTVTCGPRSREETAGSCHRGLRKEQRPGSGPSPAPRPSLRASCPLLPQDTCKTGGTFYPLRHRVPCFPWISPFSSHDDPMRQVHHHPHPADEETEALA